MSKRKRTKLDEDTTAGDERKDVFVDKLLPDINIKDVISLARKFGTVRMSFMFDYGKNCTYILTFDNESSAAAFVRSKPSIADGKPVTVSFYVDDHTETPEFYFECEHNPTPNMNADCLELIFQYLDYVELVNASRTCKQWYNISMYVIQRLTQFPIPTPRFSKPKASWPVGTKPRLKNVKVYEENYVDMLQRSNFTSLDLSLCSCNISDKVAKGVIDHCPNISKLEGLLGFKKRLALTFFNSISNLTYLNVSECEYVSEQTLQLILTNSTSLEHLDVSRNRKVTGECFKNHLPYTLKYLDISATTCGKGDVSIDVLGTISKRCPLLETLDLSYLWAMMLLIDCDDEEFVTELLPENHDEMQMMPALKTLRMVKIRTKDELNSDEDTTVTLTLQFSTILDQAPNLESLDIGMNELEHSTMESLALVCHGLKYLNLDFCQMWGIGLCLSIIAGMGLTELNWHAVQETFNYPEPEFERAIHCLTSFRELKTLRIMATWPNILKTKHVAKLIIELPQLEIFCAIPNDSKCIVDKDLLKLLNSDPQFQLRTNVLNLLVKDVDHTAQDFISDKIKIRDIRYGRPEPVDSVYKRYKGFRVESRSEWDDMDNYFMDQKDDTDYNDEFEPEYKTGYDDHDGWIYDY